MGPTRGVAHWRRETVLRKNHVAPFSTRTYSKGSQLTRKLSVGDHGVTPEVMETRDEAGTDARNEDLTSVSPAVRAALDTTLSTLSCSVCLE